MRYIRSKLWYQRSFFMLGFLRLQGYGLLEAVVLLVSHRICGTPIYYYPKHKREKMAAQRCSDMLRAEIANPGSLQAWGRQPGFVRSDLAKESANL